MVVFVDYEEDDAFDERHPPGHPGALLHTTTATSGINAANFVESDRPSLAKLNNIGGPSNSSTTDTASTSSILSSRAPKTTVDRGGSGKTKEEEERQRPGSSSTATTGSIDDGIIADSDGEPRGNPNRNGFSAALSCYPIVKEIAQSVDLNTLHALSRTCRQFRANLMPFRHQLIKQTLRCENEYIETLADLWSNGAPVPDSLKSVLRLVSRDAIQPGRLTSAKVRKCARDMVGECRRCSRVVCRNCTVKPPSDSMLKNRLRRLCTTCRTAPLAYHLSSTRAQPQFESRDLSSSLSFSSLSDEENLNPPPTTTPSFTASAFIRTPCSCEDAVWLCYKCGQTLRSNDTTYRRVWTWRTRYSTSLGAGLGTGIGEGCEGVKCGRGEYCLAAEEIELEVDAADCEVDELMGTGSHQNHDFRQYQYQNTNGNNHNNGHSNGATATADVPILPDLRDEEEPGYFRQEIVGVGGVVKQKAKKRVAVGACVVEHEDERETGRYLVPEENGQDRSWCAWCWRVIPAKKELRRDCC